MPFALPPCLVSQIGRTLVFESLDQAANYRQYVCKTLRGSPADIVTLCGNKLSGRGVVLGSGFKVVPVEQAPCRFGTIPKGQQVGRERCLHLLFMLARIDGVLMKHVPRQQGTTQRLCLAGVLVMCCLRLQSYCSCVVYAAGWWRRVCVTV